MKTSEPNLSHIYEDSDVEDYKSYKGKPHRLWRGIGNAFLISIPIWVVLAVCIVYHKEIFTLIISLV